MPTTSKQERRPRIRTSHIAARRPEFRSSVVWTLAALLVLALPGRAELALNWRAYRAGDGLPESACIFVSVSVNGKVLAIHPNQSAVTELDGYTVTNLPSLGVSNGDIAESPGGQLWAVVPTGLQELRDGDWVAHHVPEIAAEFRAGGRRSIHSVPLCPVRQGRVLFLLPDRLMQFDADESDSSHLVVLRTASQTGLDKFTGMTLSRDGGLWISGTRGLAKAPGPARNLQPETEWREYIPPVALPVKNLQEPHEDSDGGVTVIAESSEGGRKIAARFDGQSWTMHPVNLENIRHSWRGPDETQWVMATDSLFQLEPGKLEPAKNEEVSARRFFDLAVEPGGTFWLATSDGLFRNAPPLWRRPPAAREINSPAHCLAEDSTGRIWFVAGGKLHSLQNDSRREYPLPRALSDDSRIVRAIFPLKNGTLLLDAGEQLFQFQPDRGSFDGIPAGTDGARIRPLGLLKDGSLCVESRSAGGNNSLQLFDGTKFQPLSDPALGPTLAGDFATLFIAQNGDFWLSGAQGIAWGHEKKWREFPRSEKGIPEQVLGFVELTDGRVWCATKDKLWEFDGRDWSSVRTGFDHINALLRTRDGSIWIATEGGLQRFFRGAWTENAREEGLSSAAARDLLEDQRRRLWAATERGLSLYHPEADTDPPRTSIQQLADKETNVREGGTITLTFAGQDKWKFTRPGRLLYSYRLDEREWSPLQQANTVSFTDLPPGKHYFQVRAMDRNCNLDPAPARIEFAVIVPWYKEMRLVLIAFTGMGVALFFAALALNRHRRLRRSYAEVEQQVAERTRELERANRELLHSQKMNALGTLAAGIAHDFNNILSIIKGSAQIIEDNTGNPEKIRTRVDRIKMVVEQGSGIVKAMLGFSRESDQQPTACNLNAVVDDTIKLLGDRFLREAEVRFDRGPDLPEVPAARDFIQQILLNFIFNAAEAMTGRKQVVIATRRLAALPAGLVSQPAPGASYVAISVKDSGSGISPENMPRIFEPFFTTKALSTRRGTGLGLSMVYELAKKMEAGLAVESVLNEGSTFTLILPEREPAAKTTPEIPENKSIPAQP